MAFNFLGIFEEEEMDVLLSFARDQLEDVDGRINHLRGEIRKYGWLQIERDEDGDPVDFRIYPPNSMLDKYVRSYQYYGGDVLELDVKPRGDWVYFSKGEGNLDIEEGWGGGKPVGASYDADKPWEDEDPAIATSKIKGWMKDAIRRKRETFEYKIKRVVDLVDQHLEEIIELVKRSTGSETIDDLEKQINFFISQENYPSAGKEDPQDDFEGDF